MKTQEIRDLGRQELEKKIRDTRTELVNLRLRKQTGQVEKPHLLKTLRRDLARFQTILNQRKQDVAESNQS